MSAAQADAISRLAAWVVPVDGAPVGLVPLFGDDRPVVLDIGFGTGEVTAAMAADDPETGLLAVDVHTPGVGRLLLLAEKAGLTNVRVADGDAVTLLGMLAPASLAGIRVFFPDPWPKSKHRKRRLIRPAYADLMAARLRPGGWLHVATDWSDYAQQIRLVLGAQPSLHPSPAPPRPVTRYERAGLAKGHTVVDLCYTRDAT